ncbi:MAG: hypothetical protein KBF88_06305 [Polyangiaceae bacterium]|nr:hypothetical protein [Polyangiaceae bacterium]
MNRRNYALSAQLHAALRRHTVSILPIECDEKNLPAPVPGHQGSGTCIIIEGRYFIATAAHVVPNLPASDYWVLGEALRGGFFKRLGAGKRGGKPGDDLDIAWIEIHSNEAAALRSTFLTLERISPYSAEERDDLVVMGSPVANQKVSEHAGRP